ncbi:helix-turn-helix domain-containing protein [Devosia sp. A16]|uniref:helix-turn-helix domain-containing protein n=1 Tax=Devosia sp. A16 TaxID=1736675 RepID=UPI0006D7FAB2|nr:helix-turn-helix transcriptional regulator [Devosia sp. A16]
MSKPFAGTRLTAYLAKRILELRPTKTQAEIATQAGFINVNMLAMIKAGSNRLPLDRVSALAKALDADPAYVLLLALEQMAGSTETQAIVSILSNAVTEHEMAWVMAIREASDMSDPPLTRRARTAIFGVFGK